MSAGASFGAQVGSLRAELILARATLRAMLPSLPAKWQQDEVQMLVDNFDRALEPAPSPRSTEVQALGAHWEEVMTEAPLKAGHTPTPVASQARSAFDLKCCPWCGGPADIEEIGGKAGAPVSFSVGCHDGDGKSVCFGYQSLTTFARKSDAVKAWNTRAVNSHDKLVEALEWYANPEIYKAHPHGPAFDDRDLSFHARAALAAAKEQQT